MAGGQREKSEWKLSMGTSPGWAGSEAEAVASEMRNGRLARTAAAPLSATHLTSLPLSLN